MYKVGMDSYSIRKSSVLLDNAYSISNEEQSLS